MIMMDVSAKVQDRAFETVDRMVLLLQCEAMKVRVEEDWGLHDCIVNDVESLPQWDWSLVTKYEVDTMRRPWS